MFFRQYESSHSWAIVSDPIFIWSHTYDRPTQVFLAYPNTQHLGGLSINSSLASFSELNIPNRFILLLTLDPWNSYDNGHSCIEVFQEGKWVLWDIDFRNRFEQAANRLDAWEFLQAVATDSYDVIRFSFSPVFALGDLSINDYNYSLFAEKSYTENKAIRRQYKRHAQVVLIKMEGIFYFTCRPSDRKKVESYDPSFVYMAEKDFLKAFYP